MWTFSKLKAAQPRAVEVLAAAIDSGRMHHAYVLAGPVEAGAEHVAAAVAAASMCVNRATGDACGECAACRKVAAANHPDLQLVAPDDKGNISIEAVRMLAARLALRPAEAKVKIAIVSQADAMAPAAQNALLKTLEEPPGATLFLLTTARLRRLLPTVRSRCICVRLAPLARLGTWRALVEAGIEPRVAQPLAALVGPDVDRCRHLIDDGAPEIVVNLDRALASDATLETVLGVAADLGGSRERADLALAILEVYVRDRLARAHAAGAPTLYLEGERLAAPAPAVCAAAKLLQELRRVRVLNVNRTLGLENVLLLLSGHVAGQAVTDAGALGVA
ncbi:MAG: DNA polymerase III subunit delta' [Deltaproteobacteria bacterium]|nr:DNA polymerase III subunit delta' [Deltaproteobacteria bacterium]